MEPTMKVLWAHVVLWLALLQVSNGFAAEHYALLIGISDYRSEKIQRLEGPGHDLVAMRRALLRNKAFEANHITTLLNSQATRKNVQKALSNLSDSTRSGDYVLVYYSGHGTSAYDPDQLWPMPYGTAALVPHDAQIRADGTLDRVLFSRTDIRPTLELMDQRGVTVLLLLDTCFSEHATRNLPFGSYRVIERRLEAAMSRQPDITRSISMEPYPYENVFVISAAAEDERALDLDSRVLDEFPTYDGMPHGALTDALLRLLLGRISTDASGDGRTSHRELYESLRAYMDSRGYRQHPQAYPDLARSESDRLGHTTLFEAVTVP